jgi:23S rRNA (guanosine2251-2'-O)-methyltransferase
MRKLTMSELGRSVPDQIRDSDRQRITLILDNIRSGLNVGSIFRTADAFLVEQIILCGITPHPPHREILKTALGASSSVPWSSREDASQAVRELQAGGYQVLPVEQTTHSVRLHAHQWKPGSRYAFVFGNEVHGVSDPVLALCEASIEIPQFGTKHSLNVAVSAGIVIWHVLLGGSAQG